MRTAFRFFALVLLTLAFAVVWADSSIKLTTFPTMSVADGRSTVTITAEIRDQSGRSVQDGTRVKFDTTLGDFRESVSATVSGFARAVLVAPTQAGVATITATALAGETSPTTITYEFVGDRSQLASAQEYIEIVAPSYMQYAADSKIIGAADPSGKVSLRYRSISMTADDIQYSINSFEVRGRKVKLKIGKFEKDFDELYINLRPLPGQRLGYGTTTFKSKRANTVVTQGDGLAFVNQGADAKLSLPPDEDRYGLVEVHRSSVVPVPGTNVASLFPFVDISRAPSTISARKAIVFPNRKIQFQRAEIYIAGKKMFTIPLMEYSLTTATPLVTEQMLGVVDSQLEINFPYVLSMRPGETSLLRFRTGDQYGRGETVDHGAFLDFEMDWDRGDDMQGSFVYSGIGRNDWNVGINQFMRLDDRTTASAQLLSPAGTSFFGTALLNHQFNGYSVSFNGDASRTTQGIQYTTQDYAATIADDPIKVGKLPVKLFLELTATSSSNELINETQTGEGARARFQSLPLPVIDRDSTLIASFTTSYLKGENEPHSLQYLGSAALTHKFTNTFSSTLSYNFTRDGFNEYVIGEHELMLQSSYHSGRANLSVVSTKSLDIRQETLFADLGYKLNNLWRVTTGYTYDDYLSTRYIDYTFGLTYKLAWREIGLIWTEQTQRIGIQFLGATTF